MRFTFSLDILFSQTSSPDLIVTLQRDQTEQHTHSVCLRTDWRGSSFYSGIIWSEEECQNQPDLLLLCVTERSRREKCFLWLEEAFKGVFEVAARLLGPLNGLVTESTRCVAHYRGELSFRLIFLWAPQRHFSQADSGFFVFSEVGHWDVVLPDTGEKGIHIIVRLLCNLNTCARYAPETEASHVSKRSAVNLNPGYMGLLTNMATGKRLLLWL